MKFIIAKKIKMSQVYAADGVVTPVTILEAGPATVTQVKTMPKDGYTAVQIGFGARTKKNVRKPQLGQWKEFGPFSVVKEFRISGETKDTQAKPYERGQTITANIFASGDTVDITGISIGRGYAGVVKRHGFHGSPASHGHKDQLRMTGSIGAQQPQRVLKGKRMAGHMGAAQSTVKNLEVIEVNATQKQIKVKGAVPGANGSIVFIKSAKNARGKKSATK